MDDLSFAKNELQISVKQRFGKPLNSIKSYEELASNCNVGIQTLRRFFGKIEVGKELGKSTLSQISRYVGYDDWSDFIQKSNIKNRISDQDCISINQMAVFFNTGEKYALDYHQNTLDVDVLNEYVKIIYNSKENFEYFYTLYCDNNWACDYIFAWLPNYNWFGQNWFRKLMGERIDNTKSLAVKVALTNFLLLGQFLSENTVEIKADINELKVLYSKLQPSSDDFPYHIMRYHTILMIEAKNELDAGKFQQILNQYLQNLNQSHLAEIQKQELLLFLCNTLIWMQEFDVAYTLLSEMKTFPDVYEKTKEDSLPVHFFGINPVFVKSTFALIWLINDNKKTKKYELKEDDYISVNGLLYNDYIKVLYFAKCILTEKSNIKKKAIFLQLQQIVEKTNYTQVYTLLKNLDSQFPHYFS